jgi:hypothetical protein
LRCAQAGPNIHVNKKDVLPKKIFFKKKVWGFFTEL